MTVLVRTAQLFLTVEDDDLVECESFLSLFLESRIAARGYTEADCMDPLNDAGMWVGVDTQLLRDRLREGFMTAELVPLNHAGIPTSVPFEGDLKHLYVRGKSLVACLKNITCTPRAHSNPTFSGLSVYPLLAVSDLKARYPNAGTITTVVEQRAHVIVHLARLLHQDEKDYVSDPAKLRHGDKSLIKQRICRRSSGGCWEKDGLFSSEDVFEQAWRYAKNQGWIGFATDEQPPGAALQT